MAAAAAAAAARSGAPASSSTPPSTAEERTWRKRRSQKGQPALRLAKHPGWSKERRKPKTPATSARKKKNKEKREEEGRESSLRVRRKLDLDGEGERGVSSATKISADATPIGCFSKATLWDNLKALAKLTLDDDDDKPTRKATATAKADLPSFSRAQLIENLKSLAAAADVKQPGDDSTKKTRRVFVDRLVLVPRSSRHDDDDDPNPMALVIRDPAGVETRWISQAIVPATTNMRLSGIVRGITAAVEAAHRQLVALDETCLGEEMGDIPDTPELDEERRRLEQKVAHFMLCTRAIIGRREFSQWGGSVVTSVVGTFLTQNVTDTSSSNAFMKIAAKFSFRKDGNRGSRVCKPKDADVEELIGALRAGELSNWSEERIKKVLFDRFGESTAKKICKDVDSIRDATSHWNSLVNEAYKNGYKKGPSDDTIDWEALSSAPFHEIVGCIEGRGNHSQMAFRILAFLIRIKRDHGSIDLEWLRYVPRAKARRYLLSIRGLGVKSVDCIRLLSLGHRAFPVDTNVARIVTRLGWVELEPLKDSEEFHLVGKYPIMADIQKYLEPLLCNIPTHQVYELHCQQITFGKTICTKRKPNCGACPFSNYCKYYNSHRHLLGLPEYSQQHERGQTNMDGTRDDAIFRPSPEQMEQYQIEMGKGTESHCTRVTVEIPPTPTHEYSESSSEEEYEEECHEMDMEDIDLYYDLRPKRPIESATTRGSSHGTDMVLIHPHANPTPMQKRYHLRTERLGYIIPDGHKILDGFDWRVPGDCNPYLLIIRDFDDHTANGTILIPCRTANRGIFPLAGTYFQDNEVFVDHSSAHSPIQISREDVWSLRTCTVYFGTSIHCVAKGQTQEGIRRFYHGGYICSREFDRRTRRPLPLSAQLHVTKEKKGIGKKRPVHDSSSDSEEEGSDGE
ncbi:hypothetical protein BS78_01G170500 [Paspalum vaginatum]|nr:hypothetical protein BS78_01G170500 [Paspalum vaginatum]